MKGIESPADCIGLQVRFPTGRDLDRKNGRGKVEAVSQGNTAQVEVRDRTGRVWNVHWLLLISDPTTH
jgi:hypothetical protein